MEQRELPTERGRIEEWKHAIKDRQTIQSPIKSPSNMNSPSISSPREQLIKKAQAQIGILNI